MGKKTKINGLTFKEYLDKEKPTIITFGKDGKKYLGFEYKIPNCFKEYYEKNSNKILLDIRNDMISQNVNNSKLVWPQAQTIDKIIIPTKIVNLWEKEHPLLNELLEQTKKGGTKTSIMGYYVKNKKGKYE